jgi:lipoyl(octanoyl) transferase
LERRIGGIWLGRQSFAGAYALQRQLCAWRRAGAIGDVALLLEHEPVITLGRGSRPEHVLLSAGELRSRGLELVQTDRGGDVTLHAPGQLVCYPIIDLSPDRRDVRRYVRGLAEAMRLLAGEYGVAAGTVDGLVGLWVDPTRPDRWEGTARAAQLRKLGAIGVRISRWVTMHGFAFNLCNDLELFSLIVPCGIREHGVASIQTLTGRAIAPPHAAQSALARLAQALDVGCGPLEDRSRERLQTAATAGESAAGSAPHRPTPTSPHA